MALNIVLFEPEIPQNTGNIARTCAAINARLHLVHPLGYSLDEKHLKRAGLDYWHLVTITEYESVAAFMEIHGKDNLYFFTTKAHCDYTDISYSDDTYLVFGKESAGIDEHILVSHPDACVRIPMIEEARSLNLSNSVAIAAYEYMRQKQFPSLQREGKLHRLSWGETK
ncbi:putative rRNA methylase SpoU family [Sphaerochaeta pleomorpha str. Grapes]|uniref:Putative tRNA (cytidine(34)-2'-O)-methyltransferase n=1 Tax=Sphaerochaeta pleomorpha (strain ATCC BAA-1885 / DSM 22778 / Grapes) TaxID=158190 RepID=G8QQL4_SPHPG|nr:tRNA (cytidine(34)-2'-O)-methyltransferase [Sphaerochaeta pleomorpha]AEV30944.1 putative rRNA methylase SpoU family [Sphaerochaeta pleomorpha str. Grapes]